MRLSACSFGVLGFDCVGALGVMYNCSTCTRLVTSDEKSLDEKKAAVTEHVEKLKGCPLARAGAGGVPMVLPGIYVGFFGSRVPSHPMCGSIRRPNQVRPDSAQYRGSYLGAMAPKAGRILSGVSRVRRGFCKHEYGGPLEHHRPGCLLFSRNLS